MNERLATSFIVLALGFSVLVLSQVAISADRVFKNKAAEISFRYPDGWVEKQPQLHSTLVLLYASDGSESTCNINSIVFEKIAGLPEQQLDSYRRTNHTRESFEKSFKGQFKDLKIAKYWRGYLGQKDAGFVEYTYSVFASDAKIALTGYVGATFANGRRYVLTCNAPTGKEQTAKAAFEHIRNTMVFMY